MNCTKRFISVSILSLFSLLAVSAYDWPQEEVTKDSFASYFGQYRGGCISSSIVFSETASITAAEPGDVAIIIMEHNDDFGWFDSTLGNSVIIAQSNNISTVYANLDSEKLISYSKQKVAARDFIGESGNSGWGSNETGLELQIIDTKNKNAINPRIMMPRLNEEIDLRIGEITLDDSKGITHSLLKEKNLPAGTYMIFHERQSPAVPYKTNTGINGLTVETLSYDVLIEYNGKLCVAGNAKYSVKDMYPDEKRQLLAITHLAKGHSTISINISDILGKAHQIRYNIDLN